MPFKRVHMHKSVGKQRFPALRYVLLGRLEVLGGHVGEFVVIDDLVPVVLGLAADGDGAALEHRHEDIAVGRRQRTFTSFVVTMHAPIGLTVPASSGQERSSLSTFITPLEARMAATVQACLVVRRAVWSPLWTEADQVSSFHVSSSM